MSPGRSDCHYLRALQKLILMIRHRRHHPKRQQHIRLLSREDMVRHSFFNNYIKQTRKSTLLLDSLFTFQLFPFSACFFLSAGFYLISLFFKIQHIIFDESFSFGFCSPVFVPWCETLRIVCKRCATYNFHRLFFRLLPKRMQISESVTLDYHWIYILFMLILHECVWHVFFFFLCLSLSLHFLNFNQLWHYFSTFISCFIACVAWYYTLDLFPSKIDIWTLCRLKFRLSFSLLFNPFELRFSCVNMIMSSVLFFALRIRYNNQSFALEFEKSRALFVFI